MQLQQRLETQRGAIGALAQLRSQYCEAMLRLLQGKFLSIFLFCPLNLLRNTPRVVLKSLTDAYPCPQKQAQCRRTMLALPPTRLRR